MGEVETNRAQCGGCWINQQKHLHPNTTASTHTIATVTTITTTATKTWTTKINSTATITTTAIKTKYIKSKNLGHIKLFGTRSKLTMPTQVIKQTHQEWFRNG